jgi:DNA-binding response OmpR family regulator
MASFKILVVDDDPKSRDLVTQVLIGAGYDADGMAYSGCSMGLPSTLRPDLVILDLSKSRKDILEVVQNLRGDSNPRPPRMLFLTSHSLGGPKRLASPGGTASLEKPFQMSKLLWMIKALLAEGPSRRATAP